MPVAKRKLYVPLDEETDAQIERLLLAVGQRLRIKLNRCSLTRLAFDALEEQEKKLQPKKAVKA